MRPTTIDGTPSRMSTMKPTPFPTLPDQVPGFATSRMNSAVSTPSGAAMTVATPMRINVPTRALEIPPE